MELLEALKVIRKTCDDNDCIDCPLRNGNGDDCMVTHSGNPNRWKFAADRETPKQQRLFD